MHSMRAFSQLSAFLAITCAISLVVPTICAQSTSPSKSAIAAGGNSSGFDMAPETRLDVAIAAVAAIPDKLPAGPVQPTWDSLKEHYEVPQWFIDAKFGLFMHWGLYSVPAYHNEWYEKHMYSTFRQWHTDHFGSPDKFGYKDFIPLFTAEKFDPEAWAVLFKKSGAKYVVPTAQHHDNFPLWDSAITPINAKQMGPKRDLNWRARSVGPEAGAKIRRFKSRDREFPIHQSLSRFGCGFESQTRRFVRSAMDRLLSCGRSQRRSLPKISR